MSTITAEISTHRTAIIQILGYMPTEWEGVKEALLAQPASDEEATYMLECMTRVEDGERPEGWVTLPGLIEKRGVATRAEWMRDHAHLGPAEWKAAYEAEFRGH